MKKIQELQKIGNRWIYQMPYCFLVDYTPQMMYLFQRKVKRLKVPLHQRQDIIGAIRQKGLNSIKNLSFEKFNCILLQLVSALKYENLQDPKKSSLMQFLIERVSKHPELACKFYWNLNIESINNKPEIKQWYQQTGDYFLKQLEKQDNSFSVLIGQIQMRTIFQKIKSNSDNIQRYSFEAIKILQKDFYFWNKEEILKEFLLKETKIFKSNTSPHLYTFQNQSNQHFKVIYKKGDDMRSDQLVLQVFVLIENLLKQLIINPQMTLYQIMVFSPDDGILEYVKDSETFQNALASAQQSMIFYLHKLSQKSDQKEEMTIKGFTIKREIFENYLESSSIYNVITYLLGIGDRHLDNLLITNQGRFFHIDFGYILGEDPKPYPPPFKFKSSMIEVFDENRYVFIRKCVSYYLFLRKHAHLILNMLFLLVDSDIIINPKKRIFLKTENILKLKERFQLEKTDFEAEEHFSKIIQESLDAKWAQICDTIHTIEKWINQYNFYNYGQRKERQKLVSI